eukprot:8195046-Pyramimonas_sp.AAC.1
MPSARDNASSGEMGRVGAPCKASYVSSDYETIKEAEATIDGLISRIQTTIDLFFVDLFFDAKDETSCIGL